MSEYTVLEQLISEEGSVPYAYEDSEGYLTIGVGRLIDRRKGGRLRPQEIDFLLDNDIRECEEQLVAFFPWYPSLNEPRKAVLIGMAFQIGFAGLLKFKETLGHMKAGRHLVAANAMLNSKWAQQTPERAKRMSEQWRAGTWQKKQ